MPTIAETLRETTSKLLAVGIPPDEASIESRIILRHVTGLSQAQLLANANSLFPDCAIPNLNNTIANRQKRQPLAYILGTKDFYNRHFQVTSDVLVPRPETEHLIDLTIEFTLHNNLQNPTICDIGTGSGIIAVTLAKEIPDAQITATDISDAVLELAKTNARSHNAQINFIIQDATQHQPQKNFDIIVSNPPYIKTETLETLQPEVRDWEPRQALDGGPDGMKIIDPLIKSLPLILRDNTPTAAFIEIDPPIVDACLATAQAALPHANIQIHRDYAGLERVLAIILDTQRHSGEGRNPIRIHSTREPKR